MTLFIDSENIRSKRGRKKLDTIKYDSMYELIELYVIPKWKEYMKSKTERREGDAKKKPRTDTFRKKILRDMREFYRTLFRKRFHLSEFKTLEGIKSCLSTFFDELGIDVTEEDLNDYQLFRYVHQTHQYTTMKMRGARNAVNSQSPFRVLENYNENNLRRFMKHPLSSKMYYFVFKNYLQHYCPLIKKDYSDKVIGIIHELLNDKF